jgi:hypothetical protein
MPVRLPQGAGQWAHLTHFLADPNIWHKIDLVRVPDRRAPGGWRYYAHLLTHHGGYQASSTRDRRAAVRTDRRAGADANVSNLSVASFPAQHPEQFAAGRIDATPEQLAAAAREAKRARDRQRALDRSRRNSNPRPVRALGAAAGTGTAPRRKGSEGPPGHRSGRAAGRPRRWGAAARLPPRSAFRPLPHDPCRSRRGRPQRQSGQTRPSRPGCRHDCCLARQHHHRGGLPDIDLGAVVGQADRGVQPGHAGIGAKPNVLPPVDSSTGPAPDRPRFPSTACAGSGSPRPSTSAHTTAATAGYAATATSYRRCWPPALTSPTRKTRAPRGSTTNLPTPCGRGLHPSKSGVVQSTGTSHQHHPVPNRPGPAATTGWPLLNTRGPPPNRPDPKSGRRGTSRKRQPPKLSGAA